MAGEDAEKYRERYRATMVREGMRVTAQAHKDMSDVPPHLVGRQ